MKKVKVRLRERSYTIFIKAGLRKKLPALLKPYQSKGRTLILSDSNIKRLYPRVFSKLKNKNTRFYFIRPGEQSKCIATIDRIMTFMLRNGFDRSSLVVALGGGVVGDIGGFAASIYMRGIPYVQVPTTLLAQVDSSVGGKTGVNSPLGKNMIGTFCQPKTVLIDTEFLKTLSKRGFLNGYAEVIKHGIIRSSRLFKYYEDHHADILSCRPRILDYVVAENCRIKADVVSRDEREGGLRAILNFGHTYAHAIETLTGYRQYSHGQAVMLGMAGAAITAVKLKMLKLQEAERILAYLKRSGLPKRVRLQEKRVYEKMFSDKKARNKILNMIFPSRVGKVNIVHNPPRAAVLAGIRHIISR
jgi:3-dehydroquinate synthase